MDSLIAGLPFDTWEEETVPNFAGGTVGDVINSFITYLFPIAGFTLLVYLVIGGYKWLTSMGDPKGIQSARDNITYALLGFAILVAAYWIVIVVGRILDISAISDIFQ